MLFATPNLKKNDNHFECTYYLKSIWILITQWIQQRSKKILCVKNREISHLVMPHNYYKMKVLYSAKGHSH